MKEREVSVGARASFSTRKMKKIQKKSHRLPSRRSRWEPHQSPSLRRSRIRRRGRSRRLGRRSFSSAFLVGGGRGRESRGERKWFFDRIQTAFLEAFRCSLLSDFTQLLFHATRIDAPVDHERLKVTLIKAKRGKRCFRISSRREKTKKVIPVGDACSTSSPSFSLLTTRLRFLRLPIQ